ncbi:MAG TPA: hypothetical protein PKZ36_01100 [Candidatus Paceibacterota bacterium]|nr:hypothetical protein [Candidatus Paceibacterota bacterium]HPT17987.1 hypothetical protein [Candidatus Paceibacterota bacterium]
MEKTNWQIHPADFYWEISDKLSYVKMFFCSRLRLFLYRFYICNDEFHHSLSTDIEALMTMNDKQKAKYMAYLDRKKIIAHERESKAV